MARDYIRIDSGVTTAKFAGELIAFTQLLRQTIEKAWKLKSIMEHNIAVPDYTDVEALFGVPVGKGQEIYNMVTGVYGALKGTVQSGDAVQLIDRVG